jgi:hypothetical protein
MRTVTIPFPRLVQPTPDTWRVTTEIGGQEVYFEAAVPLAPRVEAYVCALTLPAMLYGRPLEVRALLSQTVLDNLCQARALARHWWPDLGTSDVRAAVGPVRGRAEGKGLFYTGGVDSSFALYRLKDEISHLLFVEGFDVKLADTARLADVRRWLETVAAATGRRLMVVRTNLRSHRLFKTVHWDLTHISALAAVAHVLGDQFGTVYVAASDVPPPYGSNPELDRLWSSDSVSLVNYGAEFSRLQRVAAIREWAPLRGHLRVCWQHLATTLNCGRCEKCLRTRLQFLAVGDPAAMDSFPDVPVADALAQLPRTSHELHPQWREIQATLKEERLRELIEALLARSRQEPPPPPFLKRVERGLKRLVGRRTLSH